MLKLNITGIYKVIEKKNTQKERKKTRQDVCLHYMSQPIQ